MKSLRIILGILAIFISFESISSELASAQSPDAGTLSSWIMQQQPHSSRTPEIGPPVLRDTQISVNGSSHKISIPDGFTMSVFAKIDQCRGLACSPDGVIYATSYNGNIYALPDHNHDGVPDSTIVVAQKLGRPHGIGFVNGELYVSNDTGKIYHLSAGVSSRITTGRNMIAKLTGLGGHFSRNFVVDSTKHKIYVQVGSFTNMDADTFDRAQIVEMDYDGSNLRTFARGLRNPVGMDLDPRTGALWVNNNGMDNLFSGTFSTVHEDSLLSDNNPSECVYLVCDSANYGWPYCYGFQMRNPQQPWASLDTNVVRTFSGPVAEVLAHEAPLGLHFYRGAAFPPLYHNAIFQCYHGSWNRYPPAPPRITVMWADSDGRNARITDFMNGFFVMGSRPDSGDGSYFGRPVSITEGADSALYVSDDAAGVIYRIRYTGQAVASVSETLQALSMQVSMGEIVPNPAENTASVSITLPEPAAVGSELFDATGALVRTIHDTSMPAGTRTILIETSTLSSGTYILRVTAGKTTISKRFVVAH